VRLDKYLGSVGTRSEIKKLLKTGIVTVDGKTVKDGGFHVNEESVVLCEGKRIIYKEFIYLILNKPEGYVSATWDKHKPVVVDLLSDEYKRFEPFPVGRLDIDTEGMLILTNDGELAHNLTSPKKDVTKTYMAITDVPMEKKDAEMFALGMDLGDFVAKPGTLEFSDDEYTVFITVSEGKFHQVKRMCEKCGKKVEYLKRVAIGNMKLKPDMKIGDIIEVTKDELLDMIFN